MKDYQKIILVIILILICILIGKGRSTSEKNEKMSYTYTKKKDYFFQPQTNWASYKDKIKVKGIYITGNTAGFKEKFDKLIKFINETEVNAVVIDVKDDTGELTFDLDIKLAQEVGACENIKVKDLNEFMDILRKNNIYPIARIVTFKDRLMALKRPDLSIKSKNGKVWLDNKGDAWLNPYNKESWEYPVEIAEKVALMGFKEVQFDYVRFPSDGNVKNIDYGKGAEGRNMAQVIGEFLQYARQRLEPLGVYVSADIFGLVTTSSGDMGLGQNLEILANSVDILCPMVYPSHYYLGTYGIKYPNSQPYAIVNRSLETAQNRIKNMKSERKSIIRPWLQDFSAPWLKKEYGTNYRTYGPDEINKQKKACYDNNIEEWIFWNASNNYTKSAYLRENN